MIAIGTTDMYMLYMYRSMGVVLAYVFIHVVMLMFGGIHWNAARQHASQRLAMPVSYTMFIQLQKHKGSWCTAHD